MRFGHTSRPAPKTSQKVDAHRVRSPRARDLDEDVGPGSRGASRTDAASRWEISWATRSSSGKPGGRARARRPSALRTPTGTRRHSSFAGSENRGVGHAPFAGGELGPVEVAGRSCSRCTHAGPKSTSRPRRVHTRASRNLPPSGASWRIRVERSQARGLGRAAPLKQGRRVDGPAVRRVGESHHAPRRRTGNAAPDRREHASEVVFGSMPPSRVAQGRTVPPAAFPSGSPCTLPEEPPKPPERKRR